MQRILLIAPQPFFQWRGSPIRVGFDIQALAELGHEVDLLTLPIGAEKETPGVRVIRTPNIFFAKNIPIGPSVLKALFDVVLFFHALVLCGRKKYDVLHCIEDAGALGVVIAGLTRKKLVFEKHSDPSAYKKGFLRNMIMGMYAAVERFTIRHSDAVIGTGAGLVAQVKQTCPDKPAYHIFDIPSSLVEPSEEKTAETRRALQENDNEVIITFVGSFAVYQGVDLLFQAIPDVVKNHSEARFIIIGGTEREIEERKSRLAEQGADKAVTFLGKIPPDHIPDHLAASDILLSPRVSGVNTPLKILDYFKVGRPIVATDSEANRLLVDENTAVLTEPAPAPFAEGIGVLVKDPAKRKALGENGSKLYHELYNFKVFKERLKECYEKLKGDI